MNTISRSEVAEKIQDDSVSVIDVLSKDQFEDYHLPDAMNVPLDDAFDENIQKKVPSKKEPVIVYCYDSECPASSKAAKRMEELGYEEVYDYEAGKVDWKAAGLPVD